MAVTTGEISNKLDQYQRKADKLARSYKTSLREVRRATKYVGMNLDRLAATQITLADSITDQTKQFGSRLDQIDDSLNTLIAVSHADAMSIERQVSHVADELTDIASYLKYPLRTLDEEKCEDAITAMKNGWYPDATKDFQAALQIRRYDYLAQMGLGTLFSISGQWEEAAHAYSDAVKYAMPNSPELSAESAILGANCFNNINQPRKAWGLLEAALPTGCPDLALSLAARASALDKEFDAVGYLIDAFVIDAELVFAAKLLGITFADDAAYEAQTIIAGHNQKLVVAITQLNNLAAQLNMPITPIPHQEVEVSSNPAKLVQTAIRRRNLQIALLTAAWKLQEGLAQDPPVAPELPGFRYAPFSITLLFVAVIMRLGTQIWWAPLVPLAVAAIPVVINGPSLIEYGLAYGDYLDSSSRYKRMTRLEPKLETDIKAALSQANKALNATIPPTVPRAFSPNVRVYGKKQTAA